MSLTKVSYSMITGDVINVKDYGAVGGAGTDDTAAIQAAFTAAAGRTVFFPAGTYTVTGTMTLTNGMKVIGEGYNSTIIYQSTANTTIFYPATDNEICNLKFTGTGAYSVGGREAIKGDPTGTGIAGIRIHIHDCYFDSTLSTTGVGGDNCTDWIIENNYFNLGANGEHGIYLSSGSTRCHVTGNYLNKSVSGGIGSNAINIKGNASCWFESNFISGVGWDGYGIVSSTAASNNLQIRNNRFYSLLATAQAIRVGSSSADSNIIISGNDIAGGFIGIQSTALQCQIEHNLIIGCGAYGVSTTGTGADSSRTVIQNNRIYNCAGGIVVDAPDNNTYVLNNILIGASGTGIAYGNGGSTSGGVFGNQVSGSHSPFYSLTIAVPSDIGTSFTPTFTSLTETAGTGAVTKTGEYFINGGLVTFFVRIKYSGTATSASVAGTTRLAPPIAVGTGKQGYIQVTGIQETPTTSNRGQGAMSVSDGLFFTPAWGADGFELMITGTYSIY